MKYTAFFALFVLFTSALWVAGCGNENQKIDALQKETEKIHDEAMKDMAEMNRIARALKNTMISATMTAEQSAQYNEVLTAIGNAENEMMDWMKNFKMPDESTPNEAIQYLEQQKKAIAQNHANIKAAMENGKKLQGQ